MKPIYSIVVLVILVVLSSCDILFPDEDKKEDTEAVPAGRILLNYVYDNVEFKYVYKDGSNDIYGAGGQNGNFDSNYGTSESKIENGKSVLIGKIDRVFLGDTIVAELKITFNDDELLIRELDFEKTLDKGHSQKWVLNVKDLILFDEDDIKRVFKTTGTDVCTYTNEFEYMLETSSYIETVSDWNKCLTNTTSHITVEIFK